MEKEHILNVINIIYNRTESPDTKELILYVKKYIQQIPEKQHEWIQLTPEILNNLGKKTILKVVTKTHKPKRKRKKRRRE